MLELIAAKNIWDRAPHCAFTDLIHYRGQFFCAFREGETHVSDDGRLRILSSPDGHQWQDRGCLQMADHDLRDAKFAEHPDGDLMLSGVGADYRPEQRELQTYVWRSRDGQHWSAPQAIGDRHYWLWGTRWHQQHCYSVAYASGHHERRHIRLYRGDEQLQFDPWVADLGIEDYANESAIVFDPKGTAWCLLRRDPNNGLLGRATAPYQDWQWRDLGLRIGGPALIQCQNGHYIAAVRRYEPEAYLTSLYRLDLERAEMQFLLDLPSGGDTSYPGLVNLGERLYVAYYSSHESPQEEQCQIYFAELKFT